MFKIDYNEASEGFKPIENGEYEVTIINAVVGKAKSSGNQTVNVDYEIRSDVPQNFQGQKILYDNFTYTPNAMWKIHTLSKAVRMPDGMDVNSLEDWAKFLLNRNLIVKTEQDEKGYARVKSYRESEVSAPKQTGAPITVGSDDLPF